MPLYDIPLEICVPQAIRKACLVPGGNTLAIQRTGDAARVVVPTVQCHQAVVFEY